MSKHLLHLLILYVSVIYIVIPLLKDEADIFFCDDLYPILHMAQCSQDLVTVLFQDCFILRTGQNWKWFLLICTCGT